LTSAQTLTPGSIVTAAAAAAAAAMQDIEERVMMLRDAVLDSSCQLFHDSADAHTKNLYG
jgi:hypothetical protein